MFLFLPIVIVIALIKIATKTNLNVDIASANFSLSIAIVLGVGPLIIALGVYGAHFLISKKQAVAENILNFISLIPYFVFIVILFPQVLGLSTEKHFFIFFEETTGNFQWLNSYFLNLTFVDSIVSRIAIKSAVEVLVLFQYFLIFGLYLNLYHWFNQKGSRDYRTPKLVEFLSSNRLVVFGFVIIVLYSIIDIFSDGLSVYFTKMALLSNNDYLYYLYVSMDLLLPFFFPFIMFLIFPLLLPRIAGWQKMPEGESLNMLAKTAKDNNFKYNTIYIVNTSGLVTAGVIGIFPRTTNLFFTKDILELLNEKEVEAVMLHEIGHAKYRHILLYFVFILCLEILLSLLAPILGIGMYGEVILFIPLLLGLRFGWGWLSRQCERQADLNAGEVQGTPEHIINSFCKISSLGHSLDKPSWHHGSLRLRINNLIASFQDNGAAVRAAYHRRIRWIKFSVLFLFFLVNGYWFYLNFMGHSNREIKLINNQVQLANYYYENKEYVESAGYFTASIAALHRDGIKAKLKEKWNLLLLVNLYNLACVYSLSGDFENAIYTLDKTLPLFDKNTMGSFGETLNVQKVETDTDLAPLRKLPSYLAFIEKLKKIEKDFGLQSWKDSKVENKAE